MAMKFTEEQLNSFDKSMLIQLFLNQQEQLGKVSADLHSLDTKMQAMMEQLILANKNRFGRSSEKMEDAQQLRFVEVDGTIVFLNEAEAVFVIWRHRNQRLWSRHWNAEKKQPVRKLRICPGFLQIGSTTT